MEVKLSEEIEVEQSANPMKYVITVAPNISGGRVECMKYHVGDKGVSFFLTEDDSDSAITGFIPNGSFGAILPL